jgi:hypothetical protein
MEYRIFDEVAKSLDADIPRRQALGRLFGIVSGAVAGSLMLGRSGHAANQTSDCNHFCMLHFSDPDDKNTCKGICRNCPSIGLLCGIDDDINSLVCCSGEGLMCCPGGECVDRLTDPLNCGSCGHVCHGICAPETPFTDLCVEGVCEGADSNFC